MSQPTFIGTPVNNWDLGSLSNATPISGAFPVRVPTTTKPKTDLVNGSIVVQAPARTNFTLFQIFGSDTDNQQLNVQWIRWRRRRPKNTGILYMPELIFEVTNFTLNSAIPGVVNEKPNALDFMADTFASTAGTPSSRVIDNVGKGIAMILLDALGADLWELIYTEGTLAAASGNFLFVGE